MASYKLNLMIVQGLPGPMEIADKLREHVAGTDSVFGRLSQTSDSESVRARIFKRQDKTVHDITPGDNPDIVASTIPDLKVIEFRIWPKSERLEVYAGGSSARGDVLAFLSDVGVVPKQAVPPQIDLLRVGRELRSLDGFAVKRIAGMEYVGPEDASGSYVAKFEDPDTALEFLEREHGQHASSIQVTFKAMNGRASITASPDGCFSISCKEDDMHCMFDRVRDLAKVALREEDAS